MKTSKISYFKAHLSEELRAVRAGQRIVILDRDIPVAEVIPYQEGSKRLKVRPPIGRLEYPRTSFRVSQDPLAYLMDERLKR